MNLISHVRTCLCDCVVARCLTCTWGSRLCQPVWPGVWEEAWATELGCCLTVMAAGWCPDSFLGQELRVLEDRSLRNIECIRVTPEPLNINNNKICINVNAHFSSVRASVYISARFIYLFLHLGLCNKESPENRSDITSMWVEEEKQHSDISSTSSCNSIRSLNFRVRMCFPELTRAHRSIPSPLNFPVLRWICGKFWKSHLKSLRAVTMNSLHQADANFLHPESSLTSWGAHPGVTVGCRRPRVTL